MPKLKVKNFIPKFLIAILLLAGSVSFFIFPTLVFVQWTAILVGCLSIFLTFCDKHATLIFLSLIFMLSYAVYGVLFTYGLPLWLIIIIISLVFFFALLNFSAELIADSERRLAYIGFYTLLVSEIFLALSYWLVNPMTRSLIIAIFAYLFIGFNKSLDRDKINKRVFTLYIYVSIILLVILLSTVSWGR